ncbi:MAG: hypothetical protein ABWY06_12090 [Pseudomonas sp.]|uniref:hypothetical protein n=1 Tax=Pseudomonas sp. TaxID=306 RepID=UPI0033952337
MSDSEQHRRLALVQHAIDALDHAAARRVLAELVTNPPLERDLYLDWHLCQFWLQLSDADEALAALDRFRQGLLTADLHPARRAAERRDYLLLKAEVLLGLECRAEARPLVEEAQCYGDCCGPDDSFYLGGKLALEAGDERSAARQWHFMRRKLGDESHDEELRRVLLKQLNGPPLQHAWWHLLALECDYGARDSLLEAAQRLLAVSPDAEQQVWLDRLHADQAADAGDRDGAITLYRQALYPGPGSPHADLRALLPCARLLYQRDGVQALVELRIPGGGMAFDYYNLGCLLSQEYYEDSYPTDDQLKVVWRRLAQDSYSQGNARFEAFFASPVRAWGNGATHTYSMLLNNLAILYEGQGRHEEALRCHDTGLAVSPFAEHWSGKRLNLRALKRWPEHCASVRQLVWYQEECGYDRSPLDYDELQGSAVRAACGLPVEHHLAYQLERWRQAPVPAAQAPEAEREALQTTQQRHLEVLLGWFDFCDTAEQRLAVAEAVRAGLEQVQGLTGDQVSRLRARLAHALGDTEELARQLQALESGQTLVRVLGAAYLLVRQTLTLGRHMKRLGHERPLADIRSLFLMYAQRCGGQALKAALAFQRQQPSEALKAIDWVLAHRSHCEASDLLVLLPICQALGRDQHARLLLAQLHQQREDLNERQAAHGARWSAALGESLEF